MVFKHKSFDSVKKKEENEENCQVLDPCHLDKLPKSWSVPYNQVKVLFEFDEPCFNESVTNIIAREKNIGHIPPQFKSCLSSSGQAA